MRLESLGFLRCPFCKSDFETNSEKDTGSEVIQGFLECRSCKRRFEIRDGLPNLNFPETLEASDHSEQMLYDGRARVYDLRSRLSQLKLGNWEYFFFNSRARLPLIMALDLKKDYSVLETGTGTGANLPLIAGFVGKGGQLYGSDISCGMLQVAHRKMRAKGINVDLQQANASYLPYRAEVFDAVLHIGGMSAFADKKRAIEEMYRVAKPGARIVCCDEGLAPGVEGTLRGRIALKTWEMYSTKPPLEFVPADTEDLRNYWIWHGLSWAIEFRKKR